MIALIIVRHFSISGADAWRLTTSCQEASFSGTRIKGRPPRLLGLAPGWPPRSARCCVKVGRRCWDLAQRIGRSPAVRRCMTDHSGQATHKPNVLILSRIPAPARAGGALPHDPASQRPPTLIAAEPAACRRIVLARYSATRRAFTGNRQQAADRRDRTPLTAARFVPRREIEAYTGQPAGINCCGCCRHHHRDASAQDQSIRWILRMEKRPVTSTAPWAGHSQYSLPKSAWWGLNCRHARPPGRTILLLFRRFLSSSCCASGRHGDSAVPP